MKRRSSTPIKKIAAKLGVSERHAAKLKADKDPRVLGMEKARAESKARAIKETLQFRKALGTNGAMSKGIGATANVQRLREHEERLATELDAARRSGDDDAERIAQDNWLEASEQLRKSEKDISEVELQAKLVIPVSEVESSWTRGLLVFRKAMEALPRRISTAPALVGLTPHDKVTLEQLLHDELAKSLDNLSKTKWKDGEK